MECAVEQQKQRPARRRPDEQHARPDDLRLREFPSEGWQLRREECGVCGWACGALTLPLSHGERADERTRSRGEGEARQSCCVPNPLTPRMSTCVGPLPEGDGYGKSGAFGRSDIAIC